MQMRIFVLFCSLLLTTIPASLAQIPEIKTGSFTINGTLADLLGADAVTTYGNVIDQRKTITWEVNIPDGYNPSDPPGVIVYISPQNSVNIPSGWLNVTNERNLIWVAALNSGNKIPANERILMSLLSLEAIQSSYKINPDRIYVSGLSGGGRVASLAATYYPNIFKGALYNCGVNFWDGINETQIEQIKRNRFVFMTGTKDFNMNDTKNVYGKYKKAGVENIKLMVVRRMGHENPNKNRFEQALKFLDQVNQR